MSDADRKIYSLNQVCKIEEKAYRKGRVDERVEHDMQIRAEVNKKNKYNVELFREIFMEELERRAVNREEIFMYRDICSMAWNKYLEQLGGAE